MGGICFIMYIWLDRIVWCLFRVNIPSTQLNTKSNTKHIHNSLYGFVMSLITNS